MLSQTLSELNNRAFDGVSPEVPPKVLNYIAASRAKRSCLVRIDYDGIESNGIIERNKMLNNKPRRTNYLPNINGRKEIHAQRLSRYSIIPETKVIMVFANGAPEYYFKLVINLHRYKQQHQFFTSLYSEITSRLVKRFTYNFYNLIFGGHVKIIYQVKNDQV